MPTIAAQALCEEADNVDMSAGSQGSRVRYGFAFLDAAAAHFYVGAASDDGSRANLTALLTQACNGFGLLQPFGMPTCHERPRMSISCHCNEVLDYAHINLIKCAGCSKGGVVSATTAVERHLTVPVLPPDAAASHAG